MFSLKTPRVSEAKIDQNSPAATVDSSVLLNRSPSKDSTARCTILLITKMECKVNKV